MAEIRLRLREADGGLPDVCMRCGEPSTVIKSKKMSWCPPWVGILILAGLLPYVIVAMIMTKRATVQAPLCDKHKGHWFNRTMLTVGLFFLFAAICAGAFFLMIVLGDRGGRQGDDSAGIFCGLGAVLGLIWVVILLIVQNTAIRPKEITDKDITLTGLSQEFVDAVEEQDREDRPRRERGRRDDDDYDDEPKPRKKRPVYDDEEDEPRAKKKRPPVGDDEEDEPKPRKKRPPSDAIEE